MADFECNQFSYDQVSIANPPSAQQERDSVNTITKIVEGTKKASTRIEKNDTMPDIDGYITLFNELGHDVGDITVQVKTLQSNLSDNKIFFDCPITLFSYVQNHANEVVVLCVVDSDNDCFFWKYIDFDILKAKKHKKNQKTIRLHFSDNEMCTHSNAEEVLRKWNYFLKERVYPLTVAYKNNMSQEQFNDFIEEHTTARFTVSARTVICAQRCIKYFNLLCDAYAPQLTALIFPERWLCGIALEPLREPRFFGTIRYGIYSIPNGYNGPIVRQIHGEYNIFGDEQETLRKNNEYLQVLLQQSDSNDTFYSDPERKAYELFISAINRAKWSYIPFNIQLSSELVQWYVSVNTNTLSSRGIDLLVLLNDLEANTANNTLIDKIKEHIHYLLRCDIKIIEQYFPTLDGTLSDNRYIVRMTPEWASFLVNSFNEARHIAEKIIASCHDTVRKQYQSHKNKYSHQYTYIDLSHKVPMLRKFFFNCETRPAEVLSFFDKLPTIFTENHINSISEMHERFALAKDFNIDNTKINSSYTSHTALPQRMLRTPKHEYTFILIEEILQNIPEKLPLL